MKREHAYHGSRLKEPGSGSQAQGFRLGLPGGPRPTFPAVAGQANWRLEASASGSADQEKGKAGDHDKENKTRLVLNIPPAPLGGRNLPELTRRRGLAQLLTPFRKEAGAGG